VGGGGRGYVGGAEAWGGGRASGRRWGVEVGCGEGKGGGWKSTECGGGGEGEGV